MTVLHGRSSPRWASLLLAVPFSACNSAGDSPALAAAPAPAADSGAFTVDAIGRGIFAPTKSGGRAWFSLKGNYSYLDPDGGAVTVRDVKLYGAPGLVAAKQLLSHPLAIEPIADLQAPWSRTCQAPWDPAADTFSMYVKYDYDETAGGVTKHREAGRWGVFTWIVPSRRLKLMMPVQVGQNEGGDTISEVTGGGTFSGTTGIALYDVHVEWAGTANVIRVYAAPGNPDPFPIDSAHYVGGTGSPNNTTHKWDGEDLLGPYDGTSDQYTLLVKISWASGSSGAPWTGAFTGILAAGALTVVLE